MGSSRFLKKGKGRQYDGKREGGRGVSGGKKLNKIG
jgi:hypothetical protein